eukprot:7423941-Pyramimonas_sp.AAC.1
MRCWSHRTGGRWWNRADQDKRSLCKQPKSTALAGNTIRDNPSFSAAKAPPKADPKPTAESKRLRNE